MHNINLNNIFTIRVFVDVAVGQSAFHSQSSKDALEPAIKVCHVHLYYCKMFRNIEWMVDMKTPDKKRLNNIHKLERSFEFVSHKTYTHAYVEFLGDCVYN